MPQLRRQSILLLASEDHKCFKKALERFAQFLQLHCQCDVVFASQQLPCLRKMANSYCWLSGKIDSADYVLIVTSVVCRFSECSGLVLYANLLFSQCDKWINLLFVCSMSHIIVP